MKVERKRCGMPRISVHKEGNVKYISPLLSCEIEPLSLPRATSLAVDRGGETMWEY
jgi:hypothetical protein